MYFRLLDSSWFYWNALRSGNEAKQKWIPSISSLNLTIKRSAERTEDQRNQRLHRPPSSKCWIQMLGAYAGDNMFRTANQPTPLNTEYVLCDAPVGLYN